jgi:hypothetical protein
MEMMFNSQFRLIFSHQRIKSEKKNLANFWPVKNVIMHPEYDLEPHEIDFNAKLNATRSKIEQINKRIKDFQIAAGVWRHDYEFNEVCFHAVCKIINYTLVYQPISR